MKKPLRFDKWHKANPKLTALIEKIDQSGLSIHEQGKAGFYEIAELLSIPKYPDDITEDDYRRYEEDGIEEPTSVFEEIGKLRFCNPDEDIRGIILRAMYNTQNGLQYSIENCAKIYFGSTRKIPETYIIYYTGEDIDSMVNFLQEGESWYDMPGVKYAGKIVPIPSNRNLLQKIFAYFIHRT